MILFLLVKLLLFVALEVSLRSSGTLVSSKPLSFLNAAQLHVVVIDRSGAEVVAHDPLSMLLVETAQLHQYGVGRVIIRTWFVHDSIVRAIDVVLIHLDSFERLLLKRHLTTASLLRLEKKDFRAF